MKTKEMVYSVYFNNIMNDNLQLPNIIQWKCIVYSLVGHGCITLHLWDTWYLREITVIWSSACQEFNVRIINEKHYRGNEMINLLLCSMLWVVCSAGGV